MPDAAKLAKLGEVLGRALPTPAHTDYTSYGPTVTSIEQEYLWHPLADSVLQQVTALDVGKRTGLLVGWFGWLGTRRDTAVAALKLAGIDPDLPAKLNTKPNWLPTGPWSKPHFIDPAMWLVAGRHNTLSLEPDGTDQAHAGLASSAAAASIAAAAAADPAVTTELLQQIRNLAEVYARWEAAAIIASRLVHTQLAKPALTAPELVARVLALFRAEGALTVLPEIDTLDISFREDTSLSVPLPPGRSQCKPKINPNYYTYCATYLTDPVKYANLVAIKKATSPPIADADGCFVLTMAGMDIMFNTPFQREVEVCYPSATPYDDDVNPKKTNYDWWVLNRCQALGKPATDTDLMKAVEQEFYDRLNQLALTTPPNTSGSTNRVTATSAADYRSITGGAAGASGASVGYLLLLLNQAAWYLDRLTYGPTRFGPKAPTRLPESIVYVLYHVGSEAPAMLSSAALAAMRPDASSSAAGALRNALRSHGYNRAVDRAARQVTTAHKSGSTKFEQLSTGQKKTLRDNWPTVAPVLGDPAVLPVLADYLTAATVAEWKSWAEPRQNILGYRRMYEFLRPQVAP